MKKTYPSISTNMEFSLDPITIVTIPSSLPSLVCTNMTSSVVYELTNNIPSPLEIVSIKANFSDKKLFTFDDQCSNLSLVQGKTCTYTVNFQSDTPKENLSVKPQITNADNTVSLPEWNFVAKDCVLIAGKIEKDLPSQVGVKDHAEVSFTFTNTSTTTATQVAITFDPNPDLFVINDHCSSAKTLAGGASCTVTATLTPSTPGKKTVTINFSYAEGKTISLSSTTEAVAVNVTGIVSKKLPNLIGVNDSAEVSFTFTNTSIVPATQIAIAHYTNPEVFNIKDQCSSAKTLASGASCIVTATLTPSSAGEKNVGINFSYAEGKPIFLTSSTVAKVVSVTGNVDTNLPSYTSSGQSYPVKFSFNNASELAATNVIISASSTLSNIMSTCNTNNQIDANASCDVTATVTPTAAPATKETVKVTLNYRENKNPVIVSSTTIVDNTLLISVGQNSTILRSTDGHYWQSITPPSLPEKTTLLDVGASDSRKQLIVTGTNGIILSSADGKDWVLQTSHTSEELMAITWSQDLKLYIAVGSNANILTSEDGKNWTLQSPPSHLNYELIDVIAPVGQPCVAVGQMGTILSSSDGKTWTPSVFNTKATLMGIIWNDVDEEFLVIGNDPNILSSFDGKNWSRTSLPNGVNLTAISYSSQLKIYVAVGNSGMVMKSSDGFYSWKIKTITNGDLNKVIWDQAVQLFIITGDNGELFTSSDGDNWVAITEKPAVADLRGIGKLMVS